VGSGHGEGSRSEGAGKPPRIREKATSGVPGYPGAFWYSPPLGVGMKRKRFFDSNPVVKNGGVARNYKKKKNLLGTPGIKEERRDMHADWTRGKQGENRYAVSHS